jgi:hypothetical protein
MLVVEVQPRAIEKPGVQKAEPLAGVWGYPKNPFFLLLLPEAASKRVLNRKLQLYSA